MDRVGKNRLAMTKPASFQEMRNRRALRDIRNLVAAPRNPSCVAGKRGLTEFLSSSNKNIIGDTKATLGSRRSITRKFAASLAKTSQPYHLEIGGGYVLGGTDRQKKPFPTILSSNSLDASIAIDVDDYKFANELPLPMVEEIEEMGNSDPKEVEMEDLALETVPVIDRCDSKDPLAVVDYAEDIYNFYRQTEIIGCVNPNYMSNQFDINEKMRAILIDWLIEVHYKFELMDETLFLTVNIIDRFLEKQTVIRKKLQLVGVTAMLLACKYEEVSVPVVEDLILISDRAYTREDVLQMERLMINTLQFDLSVPTPYVFMRRFLKAAQSDKQLELFSFFFIELCLVEYQMLKFRPSLLAAAAVFTAQCALGRFKHWTRTIELHTSYSEDQLLECSRLMVDFHQKAGTGNLTGVHRKYSSFKFGYAAKSEPALSSVGHETIASTFSVT